MLLTAVNEAWAQHGRGLGAPQQSMSIRAFPFVRAARHKDRASLLLKSVGDVVVNGTLEMKGRAALVQLLAPPALPRLERGTPIPGVHPTSCASAARRTL